MGITSQMVKELREKTGAGMMDCKKALESTAGNFDKAVDFLREKGLAAAAKKAGRIAAEGVIDSYIHLGGRVGVLLEVNCETDFVAKTADFKEFVHDVALQIAALNPQWVRKEDVPADVVERERQIYTARAQEQMKGKPEKAIESFITGQLNKLYAENCLHEQEFVKEKGKTVGQLVAEKVAKIGENIQIRRFVRFQVGEGLEKRGDDFGGEVASLLK